METFPLTVEISDPQGQQFDPVEMLAGSGAMITGIPSEVLEKLVMPEERTETVRLADVRPKRRTRGRTIMRLQGEELSTPVTFGKPGEPGLLGDLTLGDAILAGNHTQEAYPG